MIFDIKTEVKTYMVNKQCDCGGIFKYDSSGFKLAVYPPQYLHKCNKCGTIEHFNHIYPILEHEPVEEN